MKPNKIILFKNIFKGGLFSLVVISFLLYNLNIISIGDGSEFRAEIAREMFQKNQYLIPVLGNEIILTKPPIYYDYVMLFYKIMGNTNLVTGRLSSVIASLLILIITFLYASYILKIKNRFLVLALIFFTPVYLHFSRRVELEIFLTLLILLSFVSLHIGIIKNNPYLKATAYFFLALVFFTKGPLILLFLASWIILYLMIHGKNKFVVAAKRAISFPGSMIFIFIILFFLFYYKNYSNMYLTVGLKEVDHRFPLLDYLHNPFTFILNFFVKNPLNFLYYMFPLSFFVPFFSFVKEESYKIIAILLFGIVLSIFTFNEVLSYYYLPAIPYLGLLSAKLLEKYHKPVNITIIGLSSIILIAIISSFVILKAVYRTDILIIYAMGTIILFIKMLFSRNKPIIFSALLGLLFFCVIHFYEPLDISNDSVKYIKSVNKEIEDNKSNYPIYNIGGNKTSFSFELKKAIHKTSLEKLEEVIKTNKTIYVIIDKDSEYNYIAASKNIKIKSISKFHSNLAEKVYPKILLLKIKIPVLYFALIEYI
ncbi:MAG: hypothetical protein DKM50_04435 [Candidatus Margulisiibacteriota bacterium]|nr:MAG: hypothetical protein A2X43_05575 [Candidatus Margulisbacteria bacterium GWD2_39_127]OGI01024.1 MAG: hypothetical protein A2X42_12215 [Candidatus Margulisbacteria bacterium GWF2_38_17]OGI09553.1 MAG: hypothetical protein A2X41_06420 [Candidatus Margulisbacteria bacterium GWE2_39_32]PZM81998.1 MAG: hypothetical protein DKM50_04435 [Candidatus Margulisiibacteriota bacterium]HCT85108.1 hypothetical protein [Candidatus Margulisiibacteriota bacterium]